MVSRMFIGFCSGTMSTANAYIADITTPKERPALMANVGTLLQLCFMFGPGVGAGLAELDDRAPFWVGSFTSALALLLAYLYVQPPEVIFPDGMPEDKQADETSPQKKTQEEDEPQVAAPTRWKLVGILALGATGSNTAMSSLMVCQALYLQEVFGFGSLEFGFVMMGNATFSIIVRVFAFQKIQSRLGLMPTAAVGALLGTCTYAGYSFLDGSDWSMWIFFMLAGLGTIGSTFSGASVTPFFSQLGHRKNMGKIMAISSMTSSLGRVVGPPLFGALYAVNIRFPYRVAALCTLFASAIYSLVYTLHAVTKRPEIPLAKRDAATQQSFSSGDAATALASIQEHLSRTLTKRGYDLSSPVVVDLIKHLIVDALPERSVDRSDEDLLTEEVDLMHEHFARMNREHADNHPHHA